jgi:hypothetical protein
VKTIMSKLPPLLLIATGLALAGPTHAQQVYPTADAAAAALVDALGTTSVDEAKLVALLGANWRELIPVDAVERADVDAFLKAYREKHSLDTSVAGKSMLVVGKDSWVLPVPLVPSPKGWAFDPKGAMEEIRTRRIGRNELDVLQSTLAYHDAQMDYAELDRDGDGVLEYAQKLLSTNGTHDGLFWAEDDSAELSPLGPLYGDATPGGDWHGYQFRILDAQGASAPGGAYSYKLGDNMSRGFALVAWPAKYGDTGVMTFMISHEGEIFQKDLGPNGAALARSVKAFDPDDSWTLVAAP